MKELNLNVKIDNERNAIMKIYRACYYDENGDDLYSRWYTNLKKVNKEIDYNRKKLKYKYKFTENNIVFL